jgi:hypothetical protein
MKKIVFTSACALLLTTATVMAQANGSSPRLPETGQAKFGNNRPTTTGSATAAPDQRLYGGNPDAGGGPRGSVQSTNSPNASKEYGGR